MSQHAGARGRVGPVRLLAAVAVAIFVVSFTWQAVREVGFAANLLLSSLWALLAVAIVYSYRGRWATRR